MLNMLIFGTNFKQLFVKAVHMQIKKMQFSNLGHVFRMEKCSSLQLIIFSWPVLCIFKFKTSRIMKTASP